MCKERSDFTFLHITDNKFTKGVMELQDVLKERGEILAIQYQHGDDAFEIWIREYETKDVYMFMLFEAEWMIVEV